ncbi:NUDIX domain-containing protein [Desulfobotulus alkaliphilus]|uniref:NUDIX domain-containing protein n=1 Tax=Desulfobotulus alkaliphilus TaxID=622671 RepID=A0A562RH07_9BACT|nr:CoA pyrophosphatase [Desulfobotulus alkaliphilus]TWI67814.1 NUDIX domain-containing protein [Desulfobotulus alkaliphilus]
MNTFAKTYQDIILNLPHPEPPGKRIRPAAVSFLLTPDKAPRLLAIQKAAHPSYTWAGQVALPGGHVDPEDPDTKHTALRELEEELGISSDKVDMIGSLGHFMTLNNVCIEVLAGWWQGTGPLRHDPSEIDRVMDIPLHILMESHLASGFSGRDPDWTELRYPIKDAVIWGATARIIHHFMECLLSTGNPPRPS